MITFCTPTIWNRIGWMEEAGRNLVLQGEDIEWILVSNRDPPPLGIDIGGMKYSIIVDPSAVNCSVRRNLAMRASTKEYVAFLDDDDKKHPRFSKILLNEIRTKNLDGVLCFQTVIDSQGEVIGKYDVPTPLDYNYLWKVPVLFFTGSLLVKKSLALGVGGFDESMGACEDYDFIMKCIKAGKLEHFTVNEESGGERLAFLRQHGSNLTHNIKDDLIHDGIHKLFYNHGRTMPCPRCGEVVTTKDNTVISISRWKEEHQIN